MKGLAFFSLVSTALAAAAALPPLITIDDLVVTNETEHVSNTLATFDHPGFCYYDIWEYSTQDCTGNDYSNKRTVQSTDCFQSFKYPNKCIWIRPLGEDRCFHDNTVWFYKHGISTMCQEHHKFEGKFNGEVRMAIHHPWDSLILNK